MTTWVILDQPEPHQLVVKYTSDDGTKYVTMPMFWDQVTPLTEWLGRVNPFPTPVTAAQALTLPVVGMTGQSQEPNRIQAMTKEQQAALQDPMLTPPSPA